MKGRDGVARLYPTPQGETVEAVCPLDIRCVDSAPRQERSKETSKPIRETRRTADETRARLKELFRDDDE